MQHRGFAVMTALLSLSIAATAVTPQFWENFTQEDLLEGTLTRVSLTSDGKLLSAPAYDMIYDTEQPFIFSMLSDQAGNIYLGSGHEGKVFKIDPKGKGSLYYQSKELDVFAMALDAAGTLYVGTSPDGKVYKVTGLNQATEFCDPDEKYIWAMIFDEAGNLYIGTGAQGVIYKVDGKGEKSKFYTCGDNHVVSLIRDGNNRLLAGTSPGGLVIQITPDGKGFSLLDTSMEEVRSLTLDRFGTIYAVASSRETTAAPSATTANASETDSANALSVLAIQTLVAQAEKSDESKTTVTAPGGKKEPAGAKSALFAITKDGSVETVYVSKEQTIYDVLVRDEGSVIAATGPKGRLLSIDIAKQVTVITDSPEEDMTRLTRVGDDVFVAGSNQGKLYRLQPQQAQSGTFESKVLDAKTVASWGKMSWHIQNPGGATITLSTRTGNTEKPDNSWSDWSTAYTTPGQQIISPRARFLQWKANFKQDKGIIRQTPQDLLEQVQIPYLQQNLRPQVISIKALPYGIELQKTPSALSGASSFTVQATASNGLSLNSPRQQGRETQALPPRQVLRPGAQSFTWDATDDNDDSMEYSIFFKGEGESDWKLLEKKLADTFYTLNTASLPDGAYRIKIVASDAPSNPHDKALIGELISHPFVIATASPLLEITNHQINGKKVEVQFRAQVSTGHLATAEFSIDGGEWNLVFPVDGISDSDREDFQIASPELSVGEHLIGIRASDRNGNTSSARLLVRIP